VNKEMNLKDMKARFGLTRRETDVLKRLLNGLKNADIANNMSIAEQTVKDHLSRIYKKMRVKNRFELMHSLFKSSGRKVKSTTSANKPRLRPAGREIRETSLTDELTGIYNREGFLALAEHQMKIARRHNKSVCMLNAEVDNSRISSNQFEPDGRDVLLRDAASILKNTFRESDVIARVGGDEFVIIPLGATEADTDRVAARLKKNLELFNSKRNGRYKLSIRYGASHCDPKSLCCIDELFRQEDRSTDEENKARDNEREDGPLRR
jgi:diguanylate cyclase (GGDEF)-like protein